MAAPMSMKERIALFNASKSSTPETAAPLSSSAAPARRSSIADKIAALKAGGSTENPTNFTLTSTPPSTSNNSVENATKVEAESSDSGACVKTPNNETTVNKVSIADRMAALKLNSAEKGPEPTKVTPSKVQFPIVNTTPATVKESKDTTPNEQPVPEVRRTSIADRIAAMQASSVKQNTEEKVEIHSQKREEPQSTPNAFSTMTTKGQSSATDTTESGTVTTAASVSTPVKSHVVTPTPAPTPAQQTPDQTKAVGNPSDVETTNTATTTTTTTPVRRSSIADKIAALKASGEKPIVAQQPASASSGPKKVFSPFKETSTADTGGSSATGAAVDNTPNDSGANPAPRKINKLAFNPAMIILPGQRPPPKLKATFAEDVGGGESFSESRGRKESEKAGGEISHANLTRAAVPNDKRKRAVQSCRITNVNWEELARVEGIDIHARGYKSAPGTPMCHSEGGGSAAKGIWDDSNNETADTTATMSAETAEDNTITVDSVVSGDFVVVDEATVASADPDVTTAAVSVGQEESV